MTGFPYKCDEWPHHLSEEVEEQVQEESAEARAREAVARERAGRRGEGARRKEAEGSTRAGGGGTESQRTGNA